MMVAQTQELYRHGEIWPTVSVVVPLYNYEHFIVETLDSLVAQTLKNIGIVVVDDCSSDGSPSVVRGWMERNRQRFELVLLARNVSNAGLSVTRNTGAQLAQSNYVFFLDADNVLYPRCLERHLAALDQSPNAMAAYSLIEVFDGDRGIMGTEAFHPDRFKHGNHVDAMALFRRDRLLRFGGYRDLKFGWEDYELWLRMCEEAEFAIQIPEILSRYRVHRGSMLRTLTNVGDNHEELRRTIAEMHPWLELDRI